MADLSSLFDERARLAGLGVAAPLKSQLLVYYELLFRWNRKINLTSLSDPEHAIDRLLLEPVAASEHLPAGASLADLGSGGGSPAIPLALALRSPSVLMVESRTRKAAFLREASRELSLSATVEAKRFEEIRQNTEYEHAAGLVSMRAVRPDRDTLQLAHWLAAPNGVVALFVSTPDAVPNIEGLVQRSTWNILRSAMLVAFHVEHS